MTTSARPAAAELLDLADLADELTRPRKHLEPIYDRDKHRNRRMRRVWATDQDSLLDQLARAVIPGEVYAEEGGHTRVAPESCPPARLDAIDRLLAIEVASARWCASMRLPLRETAPENIRALVGRSGDLDETELRILASEMRAWRTWAATVTGWEIPPARPVAPCLSCGQMGTLRVREERHTACCMACGSGWDEATIGLLAEHIEAWRRERRIQVDRAWQPAAPLHTGQPCPHCGTRIAGVEMDVEPYWPARPPSPDDLPPVSVSRLLPCRCAFLGVLPLA